MPAQRSPTCARHSRRLRSDGRRDTSSVIGSDDPGHSSTRRASSSARCAACTALARRRTPRPEAARDHRSSPRLDAGRASSACRPTRIARRSRDGHDRRHRQPTSPKFNARRAADADPRHACRRRAPNLDELEEAARADQRRRLRAAGRGGRHRASAPARADQALRPQAAQRAVEADLDGVTIGAATRQVQRPAGDEEPAGRRAAAATRRRRVHGGDDRRLRRWRSSPAC